MSALIFTEIGIDFDNHQYGFGISTEIEESNGKETRVPGLLKMNVEAFYVRVWIFKKVFGICIPGGVEVRRKKRNNFKWVVGIAGRARS